MLNYYGMAYGPRVSPEVSRLVGELTAKEPRTTSELFQKILAKTGGDPVDIANQVIQELLSRQTDKDPAAIWAGRKVWGNQIEWGNLVPYEEFRIAYASA